VQCFGMKDNKFQMPMFRKHHAHFELPKVKVATIKLLHEFQGLHLKWRHFEHKSCNKRYQTWKLKSSTTRRSLFQTLSPWNLILSRNLKNKFCTLEKLTTLWRNLFHTCHSLGKTITFFATLQIKSLPSKGFSLSMLYKQILSKT
jgi:hypothetical protein